MSYYFGLNINLNPKFLMFEPLPHERAFEAIAKQVREAIYSGKLKPGDKLPTERDLAKMFNVRSAVLNLEQAGLLKIRKGSGGGFFVRELDCRPVRDSFNDLLRLGKISVSDLTEARGILEPEASRFAAKRATPNDIEEMEQSISDLQQRMSQGLPRRPADFNFHDCVTRGSKNPVIIIIMRALTDLIFQTIGSYTVDPKRNEEIINQHKRILDAIKAKDPENAQAFAQMNRKKCGDRDKRVEANRCFFEKQEATNEYLERCRIAV